MIRVARYGLRVFAFLCLLPTAYCLLLFLSQASASTIPTKPQIPNTPEAVEAGKKIYYRRCSFCHGMTGDGNGPAAEFMYPRPRNFKNGMFKFRSTATGTLPTDEDLFITLSKGMRGTAMQPFDNEIVKTGLTEEERWQVIYYIQTMSFLWEDDRFFKESKDPDDLEEYRYNRVVKIGEPPPSSPEIIQKGKEVYKTVKCFECHGSEGRGDGTSGPDLKDDLKFPIKPTNLYKGWTYKGGTSVKEIFFRFTTGLNGTPMPSFTKTMPEEERWALAHYVKSLITEEIEEKFVLKVKQTEGEIPEDPNAPFWDHRNSIVIRLTGQVLVKPRWQNITIDAVRLSAAFNRNEIAFHLTWDDRFKDVEHTGTESLHQTYRDKPEKGKVINTYTRLYTGRIVPGKLRDAMALQFPVKLREGSEKPHFLNGSPSRSVNLLYWRADYNENPDTGRPVVELNAKGFKKPFKIQVKEQQQSSGRGVFKDGQWNLVIKRPLLTEDKGDTQFIKGEFIPLAINAWDGSNGESGMAKSISTWRYLILEAETPEKIYLYTALTILLSAIGGIVLVWRVKDRG